MSDASETGGLPSHGRVDCTRCFGGQNPTFDSSRRTEGDWRITWNPLTWGSTSPVVVVLGFSKGPTQAGALSSTPHDKIAYKGARKAVGKILAHVGLIEPADPATLERKVDALIADPEGRFHFGSLVRCTVEAFSAKDNRWTGSGGGMLDRFVATAFGREVASQCSKRFLANLPAATRLVVMFGLGTGGNYVRECKKLFESAIPGTWRWDEEGVSYTNGNLTVVHVEHFKSQGALIPQWLGEKPHSRGRFGERAKVAVARAMA
jgi:hypothetical protein